MERFGFRKFRDAGNPDLHLAVAVPRPYKTRRQVVCATVTLKSLVSQRPLKRHRHKIPRGSRQASSRLQVVSA